MMIEVIENRRYRLWVSAILTGLLGISVYAAPLLFEEMSRPNVHLQIIGAAVASLLLTVWFAWRSFQAKRGGDA